MTLVVERGGDLHTRTLAVFDQARVFRYVLRYHWDPIRHPMVWIMLNPSTADAHRPDPTITRCLRHARRFGAGGIVVVNLFALRATVPTELVGACSVGLHNDRYLAAYIRRGAPVVAAWGSHRLAAARVPRIAPLLAGVPLWRLGAATNSGAPRHPLYVPYTATLTPYQLA